MQDDSQPNRELFAALDADKSPAAMQFKDLWTRTRQGDPHLATLGAFIEGERLISREAFQECELAHMQLKQLRYVMLMQALNVEGLSGDAAREVAGRYQASLAKADEMMEQIRKWLSN